MTQKEEWAQWVAEDSRMTYQKCQKLETENMQLSEQMKKMNRFNNENITLVNVSRAQ